MEKRIAEVRRISGLSLEKFGERLDISGNYVWMLENGKRIPSGTLIKAICCEFNIDEEWLRTGEGEMYSKTYEDALEAMCAERGLSHADYVVIRNIMEMPREAREAVTAYMLKFAADIAAEQCAPAAPKNVHEWTREEMHAEVDRQFDEEEKGTGEPSTGSPPESASDCA